MSSDSSDSKEQLSVKRESPNKQKEFFVENVLDDIMGEDLNFEDFDDDVDQKHLQTEKMGKQVNNNTQQRNVDGKKASQTEVKQTKTTSSSSVQDKESSSQKRSLTSLENDKTIKIKDLQENSATQTKEKEAKENDAKEEQEKQNTKVDNKQSQSPRAISSKQKPTRYFIIKSNNYEHLEISMQKSIWSTQPHNEQKLNEAFETSEVILIFSINNSRHFQGYCKMASKIGRETTNIWNQPSGHLSHNHHHQSHHGHHESPWGGVFKVEWLARFNLPFGETLHLRNPWNENKPVKISRDGQELPMDIGRELCKLLDQGSIVDKKRKTPSSSEQHESKKPKYDTEISNNNNNNDGRSSTTSQREGESSTSRSRRNSSRRSHSRSPRRSKSPKRGRSRSPRDRSSRSHRTQAEKYDHVRYRRSKSRSRSRSPTSRKSRSSMDLLNMTYEDYLSAVNDKYRWSSNHPSHFPGFLPGFSEVDYMNYMAWAAKQQSGADMYSYQNSRRRK